MTTPLLRRGAIASERGVVSTGPDDFTFTPALPVVGDTVTFSVISPRGGVTYTWDRTADGVADYSGTSFSYAYTSVGDKQVDLFANGVLMTTKLITVSPGGGAPPAGALHMHRLTMDPNSTDSYPAITDHYAGLWAVGQSATTQLASNGSYMTVGWADSSWLYFNAPRELWTLFSFKPVIGVEVGRLMNFHNHPLLGGWTPEGSGVSAIALDQGAGQAGGWQGQSGIVLVIEPSSPLGQYHWQIFSDAEVEAARASSTYIDIVIKIGIRTDFTGYVQIWVNGGSTPRVNLSNVKTAWVNQTGYAVWTGGYNSGGVSTRQTWDLSFARHGRTLAEALLDEVTYTRGPEQIWGTVYVSNGQPSYTHTPLSTRDASLFRLPVSLGGSG